MNKERPIRVLLAAMPALLADIVSQVVQSVPGTAIVGRLAEGEDLVAAVRRTRTDVVVVGENEEDAKQEYAPLMSGIPGIRVLTIASDGRTGQLYELRPKRTPLGELSVDALRRAIRDWRAT
ncbi:MULTISPECIES: hypothetical protein [unclassified Burkholderia]|uniref:hypothetical protein n=1 Tax=unclassified Burkholderia TaxID=2613784 RepID=UPI00142418CE|nr:MULTISPECIES: hypothetical protein [unclassified Burkholderia]NIE58656.1 hypothetical protein [Burkholderia sp. Ap-955]NIF10143.1 hypothetical protein [Burkholderia sp. Ax-1735]NIG03594.1 hypothetical protein [Burkholderia sp. Tr-849]